MKTFSQIDTTNVTSEQIGTCYKFFVGSKAAYSVQSERDASVEYTVSFTREQGFTCTCPAGERGFANCKKGYCKHIAYAVATEKEVRTAVAALEAVSEKQEEVAEVPTLIVNGQAADLDTINRVFIDARPARTSNAKPQSPKAFSILK